MTTFTCTHCSTPFEREASRNYKSIKLFCSHKCSATYNNIHRTPRKPCDYPKCGKPISTKRIYCSHACQHRHQYEETVRLAIESGYFYDTDKFNTSTQVVRRYLRESYGDQCSICHISEWQDKPLSLVLDHINGQSNDWRISNLRLVCPNCDSQLPTFKARNKGNGRAYRRKSQSGESNPTKG